MQRAALEVQPVVPVPSLFYPFFPPLFFPRFPLCWSWLFHLLLVPSREMKNMSSTDTLGHSRVGIRRNQMAKCSRLKQTQNDADGNFQYTGNAQHPPAMQTTYTMLRWLISDSGHVGCLNNNGACPIKMYLPKLPLLHTGAMVGVLGYTPQPINNPITTVCRDHKRATKQQQRSNSKSTVAKKKKGMLKARMHHHNMWCVACMRGGSMKHTYPRTGI